VSRAGKDAPLVIGGVPKVDLLPPEVHRERKAAATRRRLLITAIGIVAIMVAGTGASTVLASQAQSRLDDEQSRTASLIAEQTKYLEVRSVQSQVALVQAAQQVGVSTEVDWKKYLTSVAQTLPEGVSIDTVTLEFGSPFAAYSQPTAPLQGSRVGTVTFDATSATLPNVPTWLDALATLPGFADALPGSVSRDETTGAYTVNIVMHVNDGAYSKRFATEGK
jgi:Tfp pilus assembly protein PilN